MPIQLTISDRFLSRTLRILGVVVLVAVLAWLGLQLYDSSSPSNESDGAQLVEALDSSSVHAVTLDNDRVYFGTVKTGGDGFINLQNAYYIREAGTEKEGSRQRVVSVSEIATEPDNDMLINTNHITHVQQLKSSSQVARAIKDLKEN
jgi:hypothetical protein